MGIINKYPYTDFHEMNLDWFLDEFKKLYDSWVQFKADTEQEIDDFETAVRNDFADLVAQFDDFKDYVNNYLNTLDFPGAVADVITEMVNDGRFLNIMLPSINSEVTEWLNDHVTPTSPVVDNTLTISGAAADSKVTGDNFKRSIQDIELVLTSDNVPSIYPDLTSFRNASMILVNKTAASLLTDTPFTDNGFHLMTGRCNTPVNMSFQIAITYDETRPTMAVRTYNPTSGSYNDWMYSVNYNRFIKDLLLTLTTSNVPSVYPDLTSFENGSMIIVTSGASSLLTDSPFNGFPYYVLTGRCNTSVNMSFQLAIPYTGQSPYMMAIRTFNLVGASYEPWQFINKDIQPTGDTTNRRPLIQSLLEQTRHVVLPPGDFYLGDMLTMPADSILEGSGKATRLIHNGANGVMIRMNSGVTVRNIQLVGDINGIGEKPSEQGNRTGLGWNTSGYTNAIIENCWINNFNNFGIMLYNQGTPVKKNVLISNCFIHDCYIGIFTRNSEFHRITNCSINGCYIAVRNLGGNNYFENVGVDRSYLGFDLYDDSNSGHSSIIGCSINHVDTYGLKIVDTGRMMISGCNFYYSNIRLENTNGNVINTCGFGTSAVVEVVGGSCNIFNACMMRDSANTITVTNNTHTIINSCYTRNGAVVIPIVSNP